MLQLWAAVHYRIEYQCTSIHVIEGQKTRKLAEAKNLKLREVIFQHIRSHTQHASNEFDFPLVWFHWGELKSELIEVRQGKGGTEPLLCHVTE